MSRVKRKDKNFFPFYEVWARIIKESEIKKFSQLAEIVETSGSNVTKRANEEKSPIEWAYWVSKETGLTIDWILTGSEPKKYLLQQEAKSPLVQSNIKFQLLVEWVTKLSGGNLANSEWFWIQLDTAFPMYKEWRLEKEEKGRTNDIVRGSQKIA